MMIFGAFFRLRFFLDFIFDFFITFTSSFCPFTWETFNFSAGSSDIESRLISEAPEDY